MFSVSCICDEEERRGDNDDLDDIDVLSDGVDDKDDEESNVDMIFKFLVLPLW